MNQVRWLYGIMLISLIITPYVHGFGQKTFFGIRSQSVNAALELVGWQQFIHRFHTDRWYQTLTIAPVYTRSWDSERIARFLFGKSTLVFSGSHAVDRGADDILADYFGLSPSFKSVVTFKPTITNFMMDFDWFLGLDSVVRGLYVRVHMPIVHSKWDLKLTECVGTPEPTTKNFFPAGYMGPTRINEANISVQDAMEGVSTTTFGDMREPLKYGKIFGRETLVHISDIQIAVGWDFLQDTWYHCGALVRTSLATGNKPNGEFLFEPIIGNCHHWELGAGITGHVECWRSANNAHTILLYVDANMTHFFAAKQLRCFDLKTSGTGSRYMLLEEMGSPSSNLFIDGATGAASAFQYQGKLIPAINRTTFETTISIAFQADIAAKLTYQHHNLSVDLGYNFWIRSAEKLKSRGCLESNHLAIKGDSQLYGFNGAGTPFALGTTQSKATLHGGQGTGNSNFQNLNADNPVLAANSVALLNQFPSATFDVSPGTVRTSHSSVLLTDADINEQSGLLPRALSHKLFAHLSYAWPNEELKLTPFLGGGFSAEFARPDVCTNSAFSQWSVWIKGGLAF